MLYTLPRLQDHKSYRLNRNMLYFFCKLRKVDRNSSFNTLTDYFDSEFSHFLSLAKQSTLKAHFNVFFDRFKMMKKVDRDIVIQRFFNSQDIHHILSDVSINGQLLKILSLPKPIRASLKRLFNYLYSNTLSSFGRLKDHYKRVFDSLETNICPFCGIEFLNEPSIIRQDYDHMLMQSRYIFSGVNMNNLVPAGIECNRINKHDVDVLYNINIRTVFNSAYHNSYDVRISLQGSVPPVAPNSLGMWNITISPLNNYTQEWARVYNIKERYSKNILKKFYSAWLKELREYLYIANRLPITSNDLIDELAAKALTMKENPTLSSGNIVKGALYEFISENDPLYFPAILNYINSR